MLEIKDIEKLAKLARISLTDEEKEKLLKEIDPILSYVTVIKEATANLKDERNVSMHRNVLRDDEVTHSSGQYSESIEADMPDKKDGYLKVKKIIG